MLRTLNTAAHPLPPGMPRTAPPASRPGTSAARHVALAVLVAAVGASRGPTPGAAQAPEEILSYDATVVLRSDGWMVVTESISARVTGEEIRRGLHRDFPTSLPRAFGLGRIEAPFQVLSVSRDGRAEPYSVETVGGIAGRAGVRVRIGDPKVMLSHGIHTWTLAYTTARWVTFGDTSDELDWNATGNGWGIPIEHASVRILLPAPTDSSRITMEAWTGPLGSKASAAVMRWSPRSGEHGGAVFETTKSLAPHEGLTVRLVFPRGIVAPPTPEEKRLWLRMDWAGYLETAPLLALLLALYLAMWWRVGRDPAAGPVVVRYSPPAGFSPAALGFLRRRGYHPSLLASALVDMAVKGVVSLTKSGSKWKVERSSAGTEELSVEERVVHSALLGDDEELELSPAHAPTLRKAVRALRRTLSRELERTYLVVNRWWFVAALTVTFAGFAYLTWRWHYAVPREAWVFGLWLTLWSAVTGTLVFRAVKAFYRAARGGRSGAWAEGIVLGLFSLPFVGAELFVGRLLHARVPGHLVVAAVVLGGVNVLFYHLLERPTVKGRGTLNELEGFRRFLAATEADRLDLMNPPERTPELFERFLPHAIALGVERRWGEAFQGVLTAESGATSAGTVAWYSGGHASDLASVASSLGGSFSSSLADASSLTRRRAAEPAR